MDIVQKIREEVERMHNLLPVMDCDNISVNYADRICTTLEMYIDSLQEEPISKDLDKEIDNYCLLHGYISETEQGHTIQEGVKDIAQHFAQWQKEQMKTNAIDAEIYKVPDNDYSICEHTHLELLIEPRTLEKKGFKDGDKVKVIIIKED